MRNFNRYTVNDITVFTRDSTPEMSFIKIRIDVYKRQLLDEVSFLLSDFEVFDFEEELLFLPDVLVSFFWEDEFVG